MLAGTADLDRLGGLCNGCGIRFLKTERWPACEHLGQVAAGVGFGDGSDLLGSACGDEFPSSASRLGADIEHPVGRLDDVEVMLNDDEAVSLVDEAAEGLEQDRHVVDMKSGRRLVKDQQSPSRFLSREAGGELQALGLAAAQNVEGLAELQIVEAHLGE